MTMDGPAGGQKPRGRQPVLLVVPLPLRVLPLQLLLLLLVHLHQALLVLLLHLLVLLSLLALLSLLVECHGAPACLPVIHGFGGECQRSLCDAMLAPRVTSPMGSSLKSHRHSRAPTTALPWA